MAWLVKCFATVDTPAALQAARHKAAELEAAIADLEGRLEPLDDAVQTTREDLVQVQARR